jgi:hypothetical protein
MNKRPWSIGGNLAWAASIFLTGLGAKFALIAHHGMALPYLDQWPAEGAELFTPYFQGKPLLGLLFTPHNEHHIVFTRICELGLLLLNGQWDSLLEMTVNAVIQCAVVAGFGSLLASLLGKRSWPWLWMLLVLDLALPFAWENTLWGFQSSFYFQSLFSWLTLWLLGLSRPLSSRWWAGVAMAIAAIFSLATGMIALAAVVAMTVTACWRQPNAWRAQVPTWLVCLVLIPLGFWLKPNLPNHELLQPHSLIEFLKAFGKCLAWPWANRAWYAPLNLVPIGLLASYRLRSAEPPKRSELMIFGLFTWATLQGLAAAYARGAGGVAPAWRYMDLLSFVVIADGLCVYLLATDHGPRLGLPVWACAGLVIWAAGTLGGLVFITDRVCGKYLSDLDTEQSTKLASARAFIATDDPAVFTSEPDLARPVPTVEFDVWMFHNPYLRSNLPACVRDPLLVVPETNAGDAFVSSGWSLAVPDPPTEKSWGSYSARKEAAQGTFVSQPISPGRLPYLEIPVAGDLGAPGLALALVELTGRVRPIVPARVPGRQWLNVDVPMPPGPFRIVARDESDQGWFAFKPPRELGRLSFWSLRCLWAWEYPAIFGVGLFMLNFVRWLGERRARPADPITG